MVRSTEDGRAYLSHCLRRYDELSGRGLRHKDAVAYIRETCQSKAAERATLPTHLEGGGGIAPAELAILAVATALLQPRKVFEIGTFTGLTTSTFALNLPPQGSVYTMDLPLDAASGSAELTNYIPSDVALVRNRRVGYFVHVLGLQERCHQILCDSKTFDPTPHAGSVDLGFVDGAHTYEYVKNDTEKMAAMMTEDGVVFWHDYGGQGSFRGVAEYLESLARRIPVYRIEGTTLAWAPAKPLIKHCA